jgi:4-amino-4-deoxy-L-arabinose transferase-like glycosyltransferase
MGLRESLSSSFLSGMLKGRALAAGLMALTFGLRVPFWSRPLDMDEGLYAYGGWQLLKGVVPYRDLWDFKPPGAYFLNAVTFGITSPEAVNIYLVAALFGSLTALAVYKIAHLLWGRSTALLSGIIFAFFSVSPYIQGCGVNTEVFMIAPLMWFLYAILKAAEGEDGTCYFYAGLLAGLALLFKQVAGVGVLLGLIAAFGSARPCRRNMRRALFSVTIFLAGVIIPWSAVSLYFLYNGALQEWFFWQVVYPFTYMRYTFHEQTWQRDLFRIAWTMQGTHILWLFSVIGLVRVIRRSSFFGERLAGLFFPLSVLAVCAGWNFFPHYFIQMAPVVALFSARGMRVLYDVVRSKNSLVLTSFAITVSLVAGILFSAAHYKFFLVYTGDEKSMHENVWGFPPLPVFGTARRVGLDLRNCTGENETLFVWKHHPEINFYALRKTPVRSPIISLPDLPRLRPDVIRDLESAYPDYIVLFDPITPFKFDQLAYILKSRYVQVYGIEGLVFAEQGVYRRKPDE